MISKKHPIEILEQALKYEKEQLESCQQNIKSMRNQATERESSAMGCIARITGLEDALHKLNGLDNLEKKNKVADSAEMTEHQILRKGPYRAQLKWKDVEDMEIRKFIEEFILPEIIVLMKRKGM